LAVFKDTAGTSDPANLPVLRGDNDQLTCEPSAGRRLRFGDGLRRLPARDLPYNPLSIERREPAFLSTFARSSRESLKPRNSSFLGQDRMDNLMKAHSWRKTPGMRVKLPPLHPAGALNTVEFHVRRKPERTSRSRKA